MYGENISELSIDEKKEIALINSKGNLELLREKLQEIKNVEDEIKKLSKLIAVYYTKFGLNIEENYRTDYINSYNSQLFEKEEKEKREEKLNDSKYFYNEFNDEEIQAINKYMKYEKTLK